MLEFSYFETLEKGRLLHSKIDEILLNLENRWIDIKSFLLEVDEIQWEIDTREEYIERMNQLECKHWFEKNEYINHVKPKLLLFETLVSLSKILWSTDLASKINKTN